MFGSSIRKDDAVRPRKGTIRIRTLLALSMGGLVLAATAAVLTIALFASARNTVELLNDRTVLMIDGIDNEVRAKLDAAAEVVDGFAREVETGSLRTASPEKLHDGLGVVLATAPEVEVLLYWDRNMVRRLAARGADGSIVRQGPEAEDNPRILKMLEGMPKDGRLWGEPVVENGVTYVNFAARLDPGPSDVAFVVAAVSLEQFSDVVAGIGRQYGATAFMLYGNERVLAHPSFVLADTAKPRHAMAPIAEAGDPVLMSLSQGHPGRLMDSARRQGVDVFRVDVNGSAYLVMYRWLRNYGPEPIAVGAYFLRTEIGDTISRLQMSAATGVLVAMIGVVAAVVIGGLIARPVHRLADSASAVARLDLDQVGRPAASPIAEVDEQARAFNLMLDALSVFQTYVPRKLVQRLVALGAKGGVRSETRELTVMFTDMVKFSEISERMGAEDTAAFLNRHFGMLAECIDAEEGTIDKYVGDAVMAFWGAPDRMENHAARAVSAARRIAETITADNERRARKGLRPVRMRIGIHSGPALVGNIGASERINYTIVGDTVNDAQRLEALGRKLDAGADVTVLMSIETARRAGLGAAEAEDVGAHRLAGGPQEVEVRRLRVAGCSDRPG
jgi:adenylate cyclase